MLSLNIYNRFTEFAEWINGILADYLYKTLPNLFFSGRRFSTITQNSNFILSDSGFVEPLMPTKYAAGISKSDKIGKKVQWLLAINMA